MEVKELIIKEIEKVPEPYLIDTGFYPIFRE